MFQENHKDFSISNNGNDWFPVNIKNIIGKIQVRNLEFNNLFALIDFKLIVFEKKISFAIVTEVEIFIVVTHEFENQIKSDLFRSDVKNFQSFEISLPDIINNCQTIDLEKSHK